GYVQTPEANKRPDPDGHQDRASNSSDPELRQAPLQPRVLEVVLLQNLWWPATQVAVADRALNNLRLQRLEVVDHRLQHLREHAYRVTQPCRQRQITKCRADVGIRRQRPMIVD